MMLDPLMLAKLLHERLTGTITPGDNARLDAWLESSASNRRFAEELEDEQLFGNLLLRERVDEEEKIGALLMARAKSQLEFSEPAVPLKRGNKLLIRKWWWAAAAVILLAAGLFLWPATKNENEKIASKENNEIVPGRNGAILTLANGSQLNLDTVRNGSVKLEGGTTAKIVEGKLVYYESTDQITYNTMSTPNGRIFQITLPDGSNVWLNSASSIRYPTTFKGSQRKVEIHGEVYMEIMKNPKMPFHVSLEDGSEIEVLGTSFNVNAYANEGNIKTTLIDGSVNLAVHGVNKRLLPGQQAQVEGSSIKVLSADPEKVLAWKNGLFDFTGKNIKTVLREIGRWYDLDIVYESEPSITEITGKMQRNLALGQVMETLTDLGIHYRIEGRNLIVSK